MKKVKMIRVKDELYHEETRSSHQKRWRHWLWIARMIIILTTTVYLACQVYEPHPDNGFPYGVAEHDNRRMNSEVMKNE